MWLATRRVQILFWNRLRMLQNVAFYPARVRGCPKKLRFTPSAFTDGSKRYKLPHPRSRMPQKVTNLAIRARGRVKKIRIRASARHSRLKISDLGQNRPKHPRRGSFSHLINKGTKPTPPRAVPNRPAG